MANRYSDDYRVIAHTASGTEYVLSEHDTPEAAEESYADIIDKMRTRSIEIIEAQGIIGNPPASSMAVSVGCVESVYILVPKKGGEPM